MTGDDLMKMAERAKTVANDLEAVTRQGVYPNPGAGYAAELYGMVATLAERLAEHEGSNREHMIDWNGFRASQRQSDENA